MIVLFLLLTLLMSFTYFISIPGLISIDSILITLFLFTISVWHGIVRYGWKHLLLFFLITFAVSFTFENLSVRTGFPFGHYHYSSSLGMLRVPIVIIFAYFSMGYLSWMIAHILLAQYQQRIQGNRILFIPLLASFVMVMWDLTMDPVSSTLQGLWVWEKQGDYFGVPVSNFFGWFIVVYLFFQAFALYISHAEKEETAPQPQLSSKAFWLEAPVVYGIMAAGNILSVFYAKNQITISMALITVFTMLFVALLAGLRVWEENTLDR